MSDLNLIDARLGREWARLGVARSVREAAGFSIGDIAASMGVSRSTVDRWERGERAPRLALAAEYGRLLRDLTHETHDERRRGREASPDLCGRSG